MKPERVCTIVMACAVLHNITIERREPEPEEEDNDLVELKDAEYFEREEHDGVTARDYMAQKYLLNMLLYVNMLHITTQDRIHVVGRGLVIVLNDPSC